MLLSEVEVDIILNLVLTGMLYTYNETVDIFNSNSQMSTV